MRDQLHLMELVDHYLDGTMNGTDRTAFEERLRNSEELRSLVEDQQRLRQAARRSPARAAAKKAYRNYRTGKMLPGIGAVSIVLIVSISALLLLDQRVRDPISSDVRDDKAPLPHAQVNDVDSSDMRAERRRTGKGVALDRLSGITAIVDPHRDTVIVTPGGIVLDVPKYAFIDSLGRPVMTPVEISLKEALGPLAIMKAGLSTMSGGEPLESGGMFHLDLRSMGSTVRLAPTKEMTAMIPADRSPEGMRHYEGVEQADGSIDWKNPGPMRRSLIPVDITTLDLYPTGYEKKLAELEQDVQNKAFKDSLFYSFSYSLARSGSTSAQKEQYVPSSSPPMDPVGRVEAEPDSLRREIVGVRSAGGAPVRKGLAELNAGYKGPGRNAGVDPARIKAIWNKAFNGTNIATHEFEERMADIYSTCDDAVLDVYLASLDRDLSEVDRKVMAMGYAGFGKFADRNDGRVDLPSACAERLKRTYEQWSRVEVEAIRREQEEFWKEQQRTDARAAAKRATHDRITGYRPGPGSSGRIRVPRKAWVMPVRRSGWHNVDRAIAIKSDRFPSANGADRAEPAFTRMRLNVEGRSSYDEVSAYIVPKRINCYQRMTDGGEEFTASVRADLDPRICCIGVKGRERYASVIEPGGRSELTVALLPAADDALDRMLDIPGAEGDEMLLEARYLSWLAGDNKRRQANQARIALRDSLLRIVFPCAPSDGEGRAGRTVTDELRIPGELTPNGDGIEEVLRVEGVAYKTGKMTISEKSTGRTVFSIEGRRLEWDGRSFNGKAVPNGYYLCEVEVTGVDSRTYRTSKIVRLFR